MSDNRELQRLAESRYDLEKMKEVQLKRTKQEHQRAQNELIVHEHPNICRSYPLKPSAAPNQWLDQPLKEHQREQEHSQQQKNLKFSYIGGQKREDLYSLEDRQQKLAKVADLHLQLEHQKLEKTAAEINCRILEIQIQRMQLDLDIHASIKGGGSPSPPSPGATNVHGRHLIYKKAEMRALSSSRFAITRPANLLNAVDRYVDIRRRKIQDHCNEPQSQQQQPSLNNPAPQMALQYPKAHVHQTGIAVPAPSQRVSRNPNMSASLESPTIAQFTTEGCEAPPTMAESISHSASAVTDLTTSASPSSPSPGLVATVLAEPAISAISKKSKEEKKSNYRTVPCWFFSAGSCPKGSRCSFLHIQEPNACTSSVTKAKSRQQDGGSNIANDNMELLNLPTIDQFPTEGCEAPPAMVKSVSQADSAVTDLTTSASPPPGLVATVLAQPAASAVPKKIKQKKKSNYRTVPCWFFSAGSCPKGSRCSFLHIQEPNTGTSSLTNAKSRQKDREAKVPRKNMKDSALREKNIKDPAQKQLCFFFMKGKSCPNSKCTFSHDVAHLLKKHEKVATAVPPTNTPEFGIHEKR